MLRTKLKLQLMSELVGTASLSRSEISTLLLDVLPVPLVASGELKVLYHQM